MCSVKRFLIFAISVVLISDGIDCEKFLMGYLTGSQRQAGDEEYARPGLQISGAISLAVNEINAFKPLVDNHSLDFVVAETYGNESESIRQTARLWSEGRISSYIGPQESCVFEARMAHSFNLPMVSYFCSHSETSNKKLFSTFARTRPPDTQISRSVASLLIGFDWRKVVLLYSKSSDRDFSAVARTIHKTLELYGIQVTRVITWSDTFHYGYVENPFVDIVQQTYDITRIYVIVGFYFEHLGLMLSLEQKGLLSDGHYFVVGVDIEQYDRQDPSRYFKGLLSRDDDHKTVKLAEKAFQSYVGIVPTPPIDFEKFSVKVNQLMQMEPFNFPNPTWEWGGLKRVPAEGAYLYDAVFVYARALNDTLKKQLDPFNGRHIFDHIIDRQYQSAMGYMVHMNAFGDAEGNYTLIARKLSKNKHPKYGLFPIGLFLMAQNSSNLPVLDISNSIDWVNGKPPATEPKCGFKGERCAKTVWRWALIPSGVFLFVLLLVVFIFYRNWMYEQELDSLLWKIDSKDIITSKTSTNRTMNVVNSLVSIAADSNCRHIVIGVHKGVKVAVKPLNIKKMNVSRTLLQELKMMRELTHENLVRFIGLCTEESKVSIVTELCIRGSLRDLLQNEKINIDWNFRYSLISDIVEGMIFLHSSPLDYHGRLKSTNCVVDQRFMVKITDYGMRSLHEQVVKESDINPRSLFWTAPEHLRSTDLWNTGSKKGDIYSFAIILQEIVARCGPFESLELLGRKRIVLEPNQILDRIRMATVPPFRPEVAPDQCSKSLLSLMHECWAEQPNSRPDFTQIRSKLKKIAHGISSRNFLDNLLQRMEQYSENLERIVAEKTESVIEEKRKTEELLYQLLPRFIAEELKRGVLVQPESYESVTIFFSDIVGFTNLSAESTPLQVVDLLNDLYTCFDAFIGLYDCYKVETIGDAYMVASGLPIRNGNEHVREIARMALDLNRAVGIFKIRHMPQRRLQLRIGFHSGPCVAGVVGLKMPKYCLFGDTVNTASRMESNGEPTKIHISERSKELLDSFGTFEMVCRGQIDIKGKGLMTTYWLESERENGGAHLTDLDSGHHDKSHSGSSCGSFLGKSHKG